MHRIKKILMLEVLPAICSTYQNALQKNFTMAASTMNPDLTASKYRHLALLERSAWVFFIGIYL